jgi:hypothetical protein
VCIGRWTGARGEGASEEGPVCRGTGKCLQDEVIKCQDFLSSKAMINAVLNPRSYKIYITQILDSKGMGTCGCSEELILQLNTPFDKRQHKLPGSIGF